MPPYSLNFFIIQSHCLFVLGMLLLSLALSYALVTFNSERRVPRAKRKGRINKHAAGNLLTRMELAFHTLLGSRSQFWLLQRRDRADERLQLFTS